MTLRVIRPVRFSAAAVVVLASLTAVSASDETEQVARVDGPVVAQHRESRFASVWPQAAEPGTTLVSRKDKHRSVRVRSPRGGRVWTASDLADNDVPEAAMRAYRNAAHRLSTTDPGCDLPWTLLAAIGRVESDHGRFAGSVVSTDGVARPAIIGVALNGVGPVAAIRDSDRGKLDGDKLWDRAVGPMQFIPTTWAWAGRDGDGNGEQNPHDLDDAALAAGDYLCAGASMATAAGMKAAIFRYNPSDDYVALVRAFERGYSTGVFEIPSPEPERDRSKADKKKDRKKDRKGDKKKDRKGGKTDRGDRHKKDGAKDDRGKGGQNKGGQNKGGQGGKPGAKPRPSPKPAPKPAAPAQPAPQPGPAQQGPAPQGPSSPSPSSPSPSQPPGPHEITGQVKRCGDSWCLGAAVLRFSAVPGPMDLDGDGTSGTLDEEMAALETRGQVETATVRGDAPFEVVRIGTVTFG